jgi:CRP-like cAMP-binding protein
MGFLQGLSKKATQHALKQLEGSENFTFVKSLIIFQNLSDEAILFLHQRLIERHYNRDDIVFKEDNPGVCLFFLKSGSVQVLSHRRDDAKQVVYADIPVGSMFGEISVVSNAFRTTSAMATSMGTSVLALTKMDLDELQKSYPTDAHRILCGMTDTLANHLVNTTQRLNQVEQELATLKEQVTDE